MRLKTQLGVGAALLGLSTLLTAAILIVGMDRVGERLDAAIAAERRVERYSALSTQVSTFLIVATESIQTQLSPEDRRDRLRLLTDDILRTFARLRRDLEAAVEEARALGFDEQSRRATQSIGIARMEALFVSSRDGFLSETQDRERLQGFIDVFATGFDPLLNEVVVNELRTRETILAGIAELRERLTVAALVMAVAAISLLLLFYAALVRPQFRRLDLLREAARRIGQEDFAVTLPVDRQDEIGGLFAETNRMAAALTDRQTRVSAEWARLNETIAARTEELRAANTRLERIDEDRRRFFADISHELRTPLTVIRMEAELGRTGAPEPRAAFAIIEGRAERLNRRIDDLLRIARSESGQLRLEAEPFDLADAVRDALGEVAAELENAGMTLSMDVSRSLPVEGDRNWCRQIVAGLARNAIRHARSGEALAVEAAVVGATARVILRDNGPGIEASKKEAVFERFGQARSDARGFGIGLALARWVIEAQGGHIVIESPVPRDTALGAAPGTNVLLSLPLRAH